ncbi:hypothetical protein BZA77DRAFT_318753 [Pyronema omphalodes]|nr:hypothetical protein BZA77DRAFT_318753 [Pyronema omphalodes]
MCFSYCAGCRCHLCHLLLSMLPVPFLLYASCFASHAPSHALFNCPPICPDSSALLFSPPKNSAGFLKARRPLRMHLFSHEDKYTTSPPSSSFLLLLLITPTSY